MTSLFNTSKILAKNLFPDLCTNEEIEVSHQFCSLSLLSANIEKPQIYLSAKTLKDKLNFNMPIIKIVESLVEQILQTDPRNDYIFILSDPDLNILQVLATHKSFELTRKFGIIPGAIFTETSCGTNAFNLAKQRGRNVAITGSQHYCQIFQMLYCVAGPIKKPNGEIVGYLDLSRPKVKELGPSLMILKTIVAEIEHEILNALPQRAAVKDPITRMLPLEIEQHLTEREQEICWLLLKRVTTEEIAIRLCLSIETVRTYRKKIYQKLNVRSFTELLTSENHLIK